MADHPPALVRPVPGAVAAPFAYSRARPFVRGGRRVARLGAAPGEVVRAPCAGRVTFAGGTPGGAAVAIRCGRWSVTLVGLADPSALRGRRVRRGTAIGAAAGRRVAFGVRRAADPFGYVDPLPLTGGGPARRGAPVPPARSRPRAPADAPAAAPRAVPAPRRVPAPVAPLPAAAPPAVPAAAPAAAPPGGAPPSRPAVVPGAAPGAAATGAAGAPPLAWVGLALAALGLPVGALGRRRAVRRRTGATASPPRPAADATGRSPAA
ncbi:hypothetical protein [Patulibacter sp. SYSU D01012]|uniref:hypothetical protein n=1 Tax=Patulibacter sp. SYSU D01012 TaxID=2817381 RepID=UPI001B30FE67|nr:hypothetical protein [Patulibacter sp. SYSU D01012]